MKERDQSLLQVRVQVDQQVATTEQIEPRERGVFEHVLLGKHQHVADALVDAVSVTVVLLGEEARQPLWRNVAGDAGGVKTDASHRNGPAVDVRGKDLHGVVLLEHLHAFLQQDSDGIGLLASGASGRPDAHHAADRFTFKQFGDDLLFEYLEGFGVSKEIGNPDQQVTKQGLYLGRRLLQVPYVAFNGINLVYRHTALYAAVDGTGFVLGKVVTGLSP